MDESCHAAENKDRKEKCEDIEPPVKDAMPH